uniref:Uncharacterized protein n=1 Tax=Leptobrachium leishanense TaxID=445787 RepID=A0A8C5R978_9ANUR
MKKERNAIDWSHASQTVAALEGKSDKWKEKEESLRHRVKKILKCDFERDNPTHPVVLKKADCLLSLYVLHFVSKDLDAFCSNLRKVSSMLKLGGRLLLFGGFNANYYTVDGEAFHLLPLDEPFVRKALLETGFIVLNLEMIESTVRNEVVYYEHIYFIDAVKVIEK